MLIATHYVDFIVTCRILKTSGLREARALVCLEVGRNGKHHHPQSLTEG